MKNSVDDVYEVLSRIGRGSYASVHKAINRQTGEICAIKKIPVTSELTNLINEIGIMSDCECKNIVRFLASACSDREVSIVMEYCCGGSVKDVMRQLGRTMNQEQIIVILKDILNGLDYLHSKNKIHRDVKAANILLNEEGVAKLGDFGVSEPIDTSARKRSIIGTLLWLPPEVINQDLDYSPVIDIWSLGVTVIEMGDGQPPYSELEQSAALKEIANPNTPAPTFREVSAWSPSLLHFLGLCLDKDATRRKSARELLSHELFDNPPSNDIVKSLVAEVCSTTFKSIELETNLCRRSECLLKESVILFSIYKERRMKVIRVDQMTDSLHSVEKDFKELQERMIRRDSRANEMKSQSQLLVSEIAKLERERDDLRATLTNFRKRKVEILEQLEKVREKQKRFENVELRRRMKLRSLEGNIN